MPIEILMPALSPTMEEGTLAKWLVKEGDTVASGDLLAEIETDKATMEFEAVDEGDRRQAAGRRGTEGVKVNTAIAILLEEGESLADAATSAAPCPNKCRHAAQPEAPSDTKQATASPEQTTPATAPASTFPVAPECAPADRVFRLAAGPAASRRTRGLIWP